MRTIVRRARLVVPLLLAGSAGIAAEAVAQPHLAARERVIYLTREWTGERDQYGRPLVSDRVLERMRHVGVEEAWAALRDAGYHNQLDTGWEILIPDEVMVGRALTTAFLPRRPGLDDRMTAEGRGMGFGGGTNQWPMGLLVNGDVIVADHYGKLREGAFLGDNLAQAIHANSRNGAIIYGHARDIVGVRDVPGFNVWAKAWHPSSSRERMLASINEVVRIGEAVVLPGDVVLATEAGVVFIPPHLADRVILGSEVVRLLDAFRIEAMREGRYTSQQVYTQAWTDAIQADFFEWLRRDRARIRQQYHAADEVIDRIVETRRYDWENW
jgi:4-hydroxy-4-methyl-2-oxoglutarate aldolase